MGLATKPLFLLHTLNQEMNIEIYNPRNTQAVELYFRGEKMAKVMGSLAAVKPSENHKLSGVLVKRGFNYHLIDPSDLSSKLCLTWQFLKLIAVSPAPSLSLSPLPLDYTELTTSSVVQVRGKDMAR